MSNRVCQKCGEEYSDTYRTCPFCEEDEAIRQGRPLHRQGGKRLEKQRNSGGAGGVMLLLTFIIIMGALAYVFFGDQIADTMGIRDDPSQLGLTGDDQAEDPDDTAPPEDDLILPESPLKISQSAMKLAVGETVLLTVEGVEGEISWFSSNIEVATVENGTVTAIAGGTATVSAVVSGESAACSVEVDGPPAEPPAGNPGDGTSGQPGGETTPSNKNLSLNKTDFSLRPGDPIVTMKVKGTDSKVSWASKDTSIATINENGVVTWVSVGTTTITATVDGQTLECIVRCKS